MLELWRPPHGAGDPVGCLTSTYTFDPGLFDEQCLSRFLEIESEPNREDLAFLLERESRLGGVYAGVLVDHSQAGVGHSLRWDVLSARIPGGKQHAKLSILAWTKRIRLIVASANLTEPGYRSNYEVAMPIDATPEHCDGEAIRAASDFFRSLLRFVADATADIPEIRRAAAFLTQVERHVAAWPTGGRRGRLRQVLVFTLPVPRENAAKGGLGNVAMSSLDRTLELCRHRGGSPTDARIASPFFDDDSEFSASTSALCKSMARGVTRHIAFCVPLDGDPKDEPMRLAAPRSLLQTPARYSAEVSFQVLPQRDADKNPRQWHAKMLALRSNAYSALLVGSSNFTCAGLGIGIRRNAEANVLTIADYKAYAREYGELETIWPDMKPVANPENAEWVGSKRELDEEARAEQMILPTGFLSAAYRAGDQRFVVLRLDPKALPEHWSVHAQGQVNVDLLDATRWALQNRGSIVNLSWEPAQPPEKLLVRWPDGEAYWPLNVEDARQLPSPAAIDKMSADDMLLILAASDPSAAFRAWAKRQQPNESFDDELDSAMPVDLDPLRRYDLHATFLHRIRRRARVLARLRENLQRPAWSQQALEWRLRGLIGIEPLAMRLLRDLAAADGKVDESMLTLTDFVIVLREVAYQQVDGALGKAEFNRTYFAFLRELVDKLDAEIGPHRPRMPKDLMGFWNRVVQRCRS